MLTLGAHPYWVTYDIQTIVCGIPSSQSTYIHCWPRDWQQQCAEYINIALYITVNSVDGLLVHDIIRWRLSSHLMCWQSRLFVSRMICDDQYPRSWFRMGSRSKRMKHYPWCYAMQNQVKSVQCLHLRIIRGRNPFGRWNSDTDACWIQKMEV